ncbi:glycosyltransferase family 2 protein [Butyrivibrio sp. MB2005]|uniref:glycosyltransferase family 2 protein n=1 Tax=Butyrivibrio sp. MB2005 TaxID=1280678 RepID=UPI00041A27AE|nr:glycosyltransferase family 2 protein [Butyrivibrio sp. MB2005]
MIKDNSNQLKALVCIILVNYNGFEDTVECVKSLKKITYPNVKIVVVDNGSTEKATSSQYLFLKSNCYFINSKDNLGFSGGNNLGIKYASSWAPDYYLLLNNDTIVEPDFLDKLVMAYQCYPDNDKLGLVCGKIKFYSQPNLIWFAGGFIDYKTGDTHHIGYMDQDYGQYDYSKEITFATGCMWLIPNQVIEEVGLLSEEYFLYCEDTDYCWRLLNAGFQILYEGSACIYHKVSASTVEGSYSQTYYMLRNGLYIIDKYIQNSFWAKTYFILRKIRKTILGRMTWKALGNAFFDYFRKNEGKRKEKS